MQHLSKIQSPADLAEFSPDDLEELALEIRATLRELVETRPAHFASNLGVVELAIALHATFDFSHDRLIWDTGHQIYPHKLLTGRYGRIFTMRQKDGLMGYPNPAESPYDLFMTGHAGCSVSTVLGLASGDELQGEADRRAVAVIGDGAFPSGIVFEAMNNAGGMNKKIITVLNDNRMSICHRVGGLADYFDRLRSKRLYTSFKHEVAKFLNHVPVIGDPVEQFLWQMKHAMKAGFHGGMFFEELGFRYLGPIDGHNIALLRKYLEMADEQPDPVLLHVITEKGRGYDPAAADPVYFHTPPKLRKAEKLEAAIADEKHRKMLAAVDLASDQVVRRPAKAESPEPPMKPAFTNVAADAIHRQLSANPRVTVLTAAMCQGNKLERVREDFPTRFFDTGICESHTVAFAAGQAKTGIRPIVDIYSTFLQRSFDQMFQEVALQNLPVTFMLDRAGLTGPDGPTHHGVFDLAYLRIFPNLVVMAPGDAHDLPEMLDLALSLDQPASIRYPKATAESLDVERAPLALGQAEVFEWGHDVMILSCGALLRSCLGAAQTLREEGLDTGVANMRFVKPLDTAVVAKAVSTSRLVITVEEGCLAGGFGSTVLEAASAAGLSTGHVRRLGVPDAFVPHGERAELLADLGLDMNGILRTVHASLRDTATVAAPPAVV